MFAEHTRDKLRADLEFAHRAKRILEAVDDPRLCVLYTLAGFAVVETGQQTIATVDGERLLSIKPEDLSTALKEAAVSLIATEAAVPVPESGAEVVMLASPAPPTDGPPPRA